MKLSDKDINALYSVVHEEILRARVEIKLIILENNIKCAEIDNVLFKLSHKAPQKAIELFKTKNK